MKPAYGIAVTADPDCRRPDKAIVARYFLHGLNSCCSFGKLFPVFFITVSITTLLLSSVVQAQTTTVQGVAAAKSTSLPDTHTKILIVGSEQDYPPFSTGMTDAEAGGFTVDLWKAVAAEAGLKYTIRVQPFRDVLEDFKEGKTDVLINLARSEERHKFADFTVPHVVINGAIFVRKGESNIRTEDDLAEKSIIVLNADLAHDYALAKGWGKQLIPVDTVAEGFRLLASGKHDAILIGKLPGMQAILALGLTDIKALKANVGFAQKFGFAVHEGNSDLLEKINEGLAITKADGTYDRLYEKWFYLYEDKEVGLLDVLKYLIPIVLLFLAIGGYSFYRRLLERKEQQHAFERSMEATVHALASTVEIRDPYTAGHQRRVADIAVNIGTLLGLTAHQLQGLKFAATIHDIGKLSIPAEILSKPTKLSEIEYKLIKEHAEAGFEIVKDIEFPWPVAEMIRQHHERVDGSGYPRGLKSKDILLEAKILAVADVVEAMSSHRPYRSSKGVEGALDEISTGRGSLYDIKVVDACLKLFREREYAVPE